MTKPATTVVVVVDVLDVVDGDELDVDPAPGLARSDEDDPLLHPVNNDAANSDAATTDATDHRTRLIA